MVQALLVSKVMAKTHPLRSPLRAATTLGLACALAIAAAYPGVAAAAAAERRADAGGTNSCRKLPPGQRLVKLNLKPDTELGDLIVWISSITCKQFLLPGTIPGNSKRVTIVAPQLMSPEEAYRIFLNALDSVGLTVYPEGKFLRVIETSKAKSSAIPLYLPDQPDSKL
jgi:type II secretory pathway component GspD/PulD (secretin)